MGGYAVTVWIPSRIRGEKRMAINAEIRELRDMADTGELGEAKWWSGEPVSELDSLLMFHKGLRYVPEIIDSMVFGLYKVADKLNLNWPPAPKYWNKMKEEMGNLYPHLTELMKKVDPSIKRIRGFNRSYFFCWPVGVVKLKEVSDEVDILLKGDLFSSDDQKDREIFEKVIKMDMGFSEDEFKKKSLSQLMDEVVKRENTYMKQWGVFFKGAYGIQRKHNVQLFFLAEPHL